MDFKREVKQLWNIKVKVVPLITGALGIIQKHLKTIKNQVINGKYLDNNIVDIYCKLKRLKLIGIEVYLLKLVIYLLQCDHFVLFQKLNSL